MKIFITALLAIVCCTAGIAQTETFSAHGKVIDSATMQPLSGASVFCQNTTMGTITNSAGEFSLKLPKGGYELVVSFTGYGTEQMHINSANASDISIAMKTQDKNLTEVIVAGSTEVANGLEKYGSFLMDNFIGTTPNAAQCTIENPAALQFFFSKKRNRLKVKAKEDLVILNNALGYKIRYQLDSFSYDYSTDISTYSGYPFFEEMNGTDEQKEAWKQNRLKAYNGSRLHFVRSWYDSTLQEEGFTLEVVDPTKKVLTTKKVADPYDSTHYAVIENDDVLVDWPGRFRVIYRNEMPDKKFITQYKLPANLKNQITIVDVADAFTIEQNGYFYQQSDIVNTGYWSWEKLAEALPYDYNPE